MEGKSTVLGYLTAAAVEETAAATIDNMIGKIGGALSLDLTNNGIKNSALMYIVFSALEGISAEAGSMNGVIAFASAKRIYGRHIADDLGIKDDAIDEFVANMLGKDQLKVVTNAAEAAAKQGFAASGQAEDAIIELPPLEPVLVEKSEKDAPKGTRVMQLFESEDVANAAWIVLVNGIKTEKLSKEHPVLSAAGESTAVIASEEEGFIVFDEVAGMYGLVDSYGQKLVAERNAEKAARDAESGNDATRAKMPPLTEEQLVEKRDQLRTLLANEDTARQHFKKLSSDAEAAEELFNEAQASLDELEKSNLPETHPAYAAAKTDIGYTDEEKTKAQNSASAARKALLSAKKGTAEFSTQNADYLEEIKAGMENPGDPGAVPLGPVLQEAQDTQYEFEGQKMKDPYPTLGPKDKCACRNGNKDYKNCHGRNAFIDPKTRRISRKAGCVRPSKLA